MKCLNCGNAMTTKRENAPYTALPGVVLVDVQVSRCPNCGEFEVAIPAIDELNRLLATTLIGQKHRLAGPEIRFLRTYLGYSSADFAKLIGANASTVSRWEAGSQDIGHQTDILLRALVMLDKKVEQYPIAHFADLGGEVSNAKRPLRGYAPAAKHWKPTELAA